mmetsp:Transcript_128280/g.371346  ORF Transcript_128280/g.371346 Transcript_128280/m.371346 type:complete len:610 (+) Transcript_128280:82-1911(+)
MATGAAGRDDRIYPFHHANIHERRWAARVARATPLAFILAIVALVAVGVLKNTALLLTLCAVLNISMWLWVTTAAMFGIIGSRRVKAQAECAEIASARMLEADAREVKHLIVFPNYKEDEEMLHETLTCIEEAKGSELFTVVLAMEDREGPEARAKAQRLEKAFAGKFARVFAVYHPAGEVEKHLDGSEDAEAPGKASNLKYAVQQAYAQCTDDAASTILTVADADCLFHPCYFAHLTAEYLTMRSAPGEQHRWTMWQAPQLPYRNYYQSPAPSRVWAYISSMYEFGGVSSISSGGHHMVFSAYSVNLQLAVDAQLWDGDVIAEDHHAYLKGFFYSVRQSALEAMDPPAAEEVERSSGCQPALRVRPVMLPVKSTSVISPDGYLQTWVERWHQAKRHCQGVAEVSYSLLAAWDMLCSLPLSAYNLPFLLHLGKVLAKPIFMHIVPIAQAVALGVLTCYWILHHRSVPMCPDRIWMASSDGETLLCGLAGAWALTWPVLIPFMLLAIANYRFMTSSFLEPKDGSRRSIWHTADGGVEETFGSKTLTLMSLILFDSAVLMGPMMVPYGLLAEVIGCWNVLVRGNHFNYVTAAKMTSATGPSYGTMVQKHVP